MTHLVLKPIENAPPIDDDVIRVGDILSYRKTYCTKEDVKYLVYDVPEKPVANVLRLGVLVFWNSDGYMCDQRPEREYLESAYQKIGTLGKQFNLEVDR